MNTQIIVEKMRDLPPDKMLEVEDFIDFLRQRAQREAVGRELSLTATKLSEASFQRVWDNPEDAVYDQL